MGVVALVPAAGQGKRLGAGVPKALVPVKGVPLLTYAVHGLISSGQVDHVVVAAPEDHKPAIQNAIAEFGSVVHIIAGGVERSDSVRLALRYALEHLPPVQLALVHDAARAFTPATVINAVIAAVRQEHRAIIPVLPVSDTMRHVESSGTATDIVDRSTLRFVQTPQGFPIDLLWRAYQQTSTSVTDDAALVESLGESIGTVPGHPYAIKITTPFDLLIAESVLAKDTPRS